MVEFTIPLVLDVIRTIGIVVGIIYYLTIMRNSNKAQQLSVETRNAQFFLQLYNSLMDAESLKVSWKDMMIERDWSTFDEWWEKYGPENNIDVFIQWVKSMVMFEIYGVLLKRGFLNIELIDDIMSGTVLMIWDIYEPVMMGFREKFGWPQFQEHQEYLTNEIRKVVEQQHPDFEGRRKT